MNNNLKSYKFRDLYEMSSGISSKPEQAGHGSPFVSFTTVFNNYFLPDDLPDLMDISEKEKEIYSIKEGDIFITRTSETLDELGMSSVAIKDYPNASFSGFLKRLRPRQNDVTYHKFMAFYLRSSHFRKSMNNNAIMTLRASFNEQIFSYLNLMLPPLKEQIKIGDFLFDFNKKIELNNQIKSELELLSKTIFDYWFIQYDFPDLKNKPYKSTNGSFYFNEILNKNVPLGWSVKTLGEICEIYQSKTISQKEMTSDGKYFVFGSNGIIGKYNEYNHENSEVVVSCRGNCGNIIRTLPKSWITGNAMVFKLIDSDIHNEFLYQSLQWLNLKKAVTGSVQGQLTRANVASFKILIPDKSILLKYSDIAKRIIDKHLMILEENNHLTELRDWLLPMLMNGQVKVGDAEKMMDEKLSMAAEPRGVYKKSKVR